MTKINIEKIKESIDIVDVIEQYVDLEKVNGYTYKASCPLPDHNDKTPSFYVNKKDQFFKCFGCSWGGDIITFIEDMEGIEFKKAVDLLIENNGINVEEIQVSEYEFLEDFSLKKLSEAINLYNSEHSLNEGFLEKYDIIHPYLIEQGFEKETLKEFQIGYCSDSNDMLYKRVTFPWFDTNNRLVAINARTTCGQDPKYLYKKGSNKNNVLFNLNNLEKNNKPIIIVESEKDVLWLWQNGYKRAVALGGTDIGKRKWLLRKYTNHAIISLDMDEAGLKGRKKLAKGLYPIMEVSAVKFDCKKDISDIKDKNKLDSIFNNISTYRGG